MKYKLLKNRINNLSWYKPYSKDAAIMMCYGFCSEMLSYPKPEYVAVLPDVVEEYVPSGMIEFDDWDDEVLPLHANDFFFRAELRYYGKNIHGEMETINDPHYVRVHRNWVDPIE